MTELAIDIDHQAGAAALAAQEVLPLLAPVQWSLPAFAEAAKSNRRVRAVALALAFMAHAAVLYALAREPDQAMAGGGGQQIDAISVTIVSSNVLESLEPDRPQPSAPAAAATVDANDGAPDSAPAAATEQHEEKRKDQADKEKDKPQEDPIRAAEAIFEVPKEAQRETKPQSAAPAAGGAVARGDVATPAMASGPAAASAGAVREFARYVSLALSRTKPRGAGRLGTVRIKFIVAADGSLASAEIAKSSGNDKLDGSALDAVRQAKFPVPPSGMSVAQLTYEVPYFFR